MRRSEHGFTLLETVVTLAVVGILTAIALPTFSGETHKSKASAEVAPLFSDLRVRLEEYMQENGTYPPTVGETAWNPATAPGARVPLDLAAPGWQPLRVRLSGDDAVLCRYTFATGLAGDGANIGPQAAALGFVPPSTGWYYLLAKCDMDGDPTTLSWYFASSSDTTVRRDREGQ